MPIAVMAECRTVERKIEVENEATLLLRFAHGAVGQFIASGHEVPGSNRLEIAGTKGTLIVIEDHDIEFWELSQDEREFAQENRELFGKPKCTKSMLELPPDNNLIQQAAMLQNFADAVAGKTVLACPLKEGLSSLRIIEAAYGSFTKESWTKI